MREAERRISAISSHSTFFQPDHLSDRGALTAAIHTLVQHLCLVQQQATDRGDEAAGHALYAVASGIAPA